MNSRHYDAIIIGTGPGGEGAAMKLAKDGKNVAVVEKYFDVGGGCTHWGTIPSKALRHAVQRVADYRRDHVLRRIIGPVQITYPELLKTAESVIRQQSNMRERFYYRNRVDIIGGRARLADAHTVVVETSAGSHERCTADHIVIATGSRPYHPPDIDFEHPRVRDSDSILHLDFTPRSVTIYGAGVIGCEYASIFASLGVKVNLINTRDRLLSFLDDEITDALGYHLRDQGVVLRHNEEYERVEPRSDGVVLQLKSGKRVKTDVLLWANGRSGNTRDMGLEEQGIEIDHRGQLAVNETYQTTCPHVFAVGDVVGFPSLASASYDQGRFAATHIIEGKCDDRLVKHIPAGIYTSPEISSLGPTERELTAQRVPYEVGRAFFRSIARAQITGHTVGMLKILFHTETHELLGIHCFGQQAAEIIHIGQAIMAQSGEANSVNYFVDTTFNYPTMAEAYRIAALNGLNRMFE
ncbi:Si-specific NAD(P)(+) transhydrogenase [Haliangium ochraceum]|uniref:Soluble pyridine nucleotide transhydrogenase n=1 Tax=Haliangium ochraceum (strain DSM 14365 / JCM 11303 / SMP-2) TaxID=502025 RepID=D0LVL8_HALO1|nr:Si-specific NAD(P)(+) transhydrogenase [Haliangium ochraceum]ACY17579.1 pyridine nucleotide-disulphide oxidoreductase dimerization region [Haliangium ochraceum DSM 14365]